MSSRALGRREFFKSSVVSGGWLLAIQLPLSTKTASRVPDDIKESSDWSIYLSIRPDNSVIMESPITEMGQFMRTTGPMMLADELDLDWEAIKFTQDAKLHLSRNKEGGLSYSHANMDTGGSHSVRWTWEYLRKAGAIARQMLIETAADVWGVPVSELKTKKSVIYHSTSQRSALYGDLALHASQRRIDTNTTRLKTKSEFKIIGNATHNIDLKRIVTGEPRFGIDMAYPNCLQAVIYRAPAVGAEIVSYNKTAALAIPGVKKIIEMERMDDSYWFSGNTQYIAAGIAVLADSLWAAIQGRNTLNPQWKNTSKYANQNSEEQIKTFHTLVTEDGPAKETQNFGDTKTAFNDADIILQQVYEKPLLAHALLEPLNCIADIRDTDATIITGHQFPIRIAEEVERFTGIDALNVEVICKPMGGGFGRRAERDWVREAVLLSKKIKAPVKVTWLREDEMERDLHDPASVSQIKASLKNGNITGWHHRQAQTGGGAQDSCFPQGVVPNFKVELCTFKSHIPSGAWRGPQHPAWAFAAESMIDELAHAAGIDPYQFRMDLMLPARTFPHTNWGATIKDSGRMAECYKQAANLANWSKARPKHTGLGIAGHFCHGSYAAFVVEVAVENGTLKINEAWGAIDCGLAINPNHIRAQMEGGFIDGLNAALFNKINVVAGAVQNNQFNTFYLGRMKDAPLDVHTTIIQNNHPPTGVGEPPTAPAAASLVNAIYAASGRRIRTLPVIESFNHEEEYV